MTSLDRIFRDEWARVVASLVGAFRDLDVAEEAAQEAFAVAAERWEQAGVPANPAAWLVTTARNRAIDRLRRERTLREKLPLLERSEPRVVWHDSAGFSSAAEPDRCSARHDPTPTGPARSQDVVEPGPLNAGGEIPDERLELLFMCCHPALALEARVALTLRAVGGLTSDEIARAFLVSREAMKRRLSRARTKIRTSGVPFSVPGPERLGARLDDVLAVVYLVFNEGYGDDGRTDLAADAVRLARLLAALVPDEPEASALLALVLLHDARRPARVRDGELVLLPDQDRALWDAERLAEGHAALDRTVALGGRGVYAVQATIAAVQSQDPIDWSAIAALYRRLVELTGSPIARLNGAVAIAETEGPHAALEIVDGLPLNGYRYFHAARAELLRRADEPGLALAEYRRAIELAATGPERRFLQRRLAAL